MSPIDGVSEGLLERFRAAGERIAWREDGRPPRRGGKKATVGTRVRIAHLHDEEARVEERADGGRRVDSGPVGALVLLLEIDRRGPARSLRAHPAGALPGFGQGAIEASWASPIAAGTDVPLKDLVDLARYALA